MNTYIHTWIKYKITLKFLKSLKKIIFFTRRRKNYRVLLMFSFSPDFNLLLNPNFFCIRIFRDVVVYYIIIYPAYRSGILEIIRKFQCTECSTLSFPFDFSQSYATQCWELYCSYFTRPKTEIQRIQRIQRMQQKSDRPGGNFESFAWHFHIRLNLCIN